MSYKTELINLVEESTAYLKSESAFYTTANKTALLSLINHAKCVIDGEYSVPFVRNREFAPVREGEDFLFATENFAMTPSYFMKNYGLKPAFEWYKSNHVMKKLKKQQKITENYAHEYNIKFDFDGLSGEILGKEIIKTLDEISKNRNKEFKNNDHNLFFKNSDKDAFVSKVKNDKLLTGEYKKIEEFSNKYTSAEINLIEKSMCMDIDYETLNKSFYIWSKTDKIITFETPKTAEFARLSFTLSSLENENDGLGHVFIDNVSVFPSKGSDWDIKNSGFEDSPNGKFPNHWERLVLSGNPTIKPIHDYPFCGSGKTSLLIQNTSENDCGGVKYIEPIPIEGGIFNTICFDAKLDGKLKKGLKITIEFLDINKKKIDEFVYYFNKKSSLTTADFALSMQCDAIVYMMTNDIEYAKKAKKQIMFILNDFCQGIEYWKIYDSRPQGSDAYGAVQGGRILSSLMSTYTLISDTFSTAEKSAMLPYLKYFAPYLLDLRDRTELSAFDSQADAGNWQTDMAAGIGFLMMAIPDFPNSDIWLSNANMILKSQLKENVHHDGSWPESIRYHFAALSRFAIYAKVLLNCTGEDWFKNGPLVSMFRYPALMQTPPCKFFDNNISTPNFGDHHLTNGNEFAPFGIYCSDIAKLDTNVADTLYLTWCRAGRPMGHYWGEAVAIENLFFIGSNYTPKENALVLSSTNEFKQAGITIFRNGFNTQNEDYFAIMASPEKVSHGHFDEGSFIIYKNNTPIIIDPGIEGYFDSTKDWYVSSSAHNVVQFERNGGKKSTASPFTIDLETTDYSALEGFNDTARCAKQTSFSHNSKFDSITLEIKNFEGGTHTRCVTFLKNPGIYIIDDNVKDFKGLIRFNLLCATKNAQINGNCVSGIGYENIDLDVVFLGKTPDIKLEKGRCLKMFHCEKKPEATIIRAMGNQGFLTVIFPFSHGDKRMEISEDLNFYILKIGESKVEINKKTHEISF